MELINLRNLREDMDLTQKDVANILHIAQRTYSHYENGTRDMPLALLVELSIYFKVSTDYLLNITKDKRRYYAKDEEKLHKHM